MDPNALTIQSLIYVLELEDDCWYIGKTFHLNMRWAQHVSCQGAKWTKMHKPLRIARVLLNASENEVTKDYMVLFGSDKVRGGSWTRCA